jgi:hypothetical protein
MALEIRSLSNRKANVVPKLSILTQLIDFMGIVCLAATNGKLAFELQ